MFFIHIQGYLTNVAARISVHELSHVRSLCNSRMNLIINIIGETVWHLTRQHGSHHRARRELIGNGGEAFC